MSSSKASVVVMSTIAILLLLVVVVAEGRRYGSARSGGIKHDPHLGMDDCGRNRTCRKLSRECKTLLFTSMVDNNAGAEDNENVTTVDKMAAMMEMFKELNNNLTDCANEKGIQLPISDGTGISNALKKNAAKSGGSRFDDKWQHDNFGLSKEDAIELRKCILKKKMMLNPDGSLNRESLKAQISSSFSFQAGLQAAVEEEVDACPEPQDYSIAELNKCIIKACIDNLQLDTDDFSLKASTSRGVGRIGRRHYWDTPFPPFEPNHPIGVSYAVGALHSIPFFIQGGLIPAFMAMAG